jgi:hypothetical protein
MEKAEKKFMGRDVDNELQFPDRLGDTWGSLLSALRRSPIKVKLSSTLHILRQLVHFGIRKVRPPVDSWSGAALSLLGSIDPEATARELRRNSVAIAGVLPAEFVRRQREITDRLPYNEYKLVHHVDDDLRQLTEDPGLMAVLRAYLRSEPELLEVSLFVSKPEQDIPDQGQNAFHFDYAGWESLNVFVYLSDVTESSSCHVVAKGSHRDVGFFDVLRGSLTKQDGARRFGDSIQSITGPAGTLFFENTEAFHRRNKGNERRVMLCLLYASHRSFLSHGRAGKEDVEIRDRAYAELRSLH